MLKSLEIDWDNRHKKLSALNVVFTSLNFALCIQKILCMGVKIGYPLENIHIRPLERR